MFIRSSRGDEISLGQSKRETVRNISPSKWLPAQDRTWPTHPNVCLIFRQNYRPFPPLPRSLLCHRFERNRCIVEYGDGRIGYDKGWKKRRVVCFINATFSNVERMAEMTKTWVENTGGIQAQLHPPVSQTQRSPPRSFSPGFPARS